MHADTDPHESSISPRKALVLIAHALIFGVFIGVFSLEHAFVTRSLPIEATLTDLHSDNTVTLSYNAPLRNPPPPSIPPLFQNPNKPLPTPTPPATRAVQQRTSDPFPIFASPTPKTTYSMRRSRTQPYTFKLDRFDALYPFTTLLGLLSLGLLARLLWKAIP